MLTARSMLSDRRWQDHGWLRLPYDQDADLLDLAKRLGRVVPTRPGGLLVDVLVPTERFEASPRSLSARHGRGDFPYHTDAAHHRRPPRLLLMRLAMNGVTDTPTIIADAISATRAIASMLRSSVWVVQPGNRPFYVSVLRTTGSQRRFRFDPGCMRPVSPDGDRAALLIQSCLSQAKATPIAWKRGEVIAIDNWRMVHRRPAVDSADEDGRVLDRALVDIEEEL